MSRTMPRDTRESQRPDDWRRRAKCLGQWQLMHPDNDAREIETAKTVCAGCPVAVDCFYDAVRTGDMEHGIRAGLRGSERRAVLKELNRRKAAAADKQKAAEDEMARRRERKTYTSLREIFDDNTKRIIRGHLAWTGRPRPYFEGRPYAPKQIAFILDRGREPVGRVLTTCSYAGCVLPAHVADDQERMRCGTRSGYQRHLKEKSEICTPCRQANTDTYNRLLRTGTTKAAA